MGSRGLGGVGVATGRVWASLRRGGRQSCAEVSADTPWLMVPRWDPDSSPGGESVGLGDPWVTRAGLDLPGRVALFSVVPGKGTGVDTVTGARCWVAVLSSG